MKRLMLKVQSMLSHMNIRRQLYLVYTLAVILPMLVLGTFSVVTMYKQLASYYQNLSDTNNLRVSTLLQEITSQVYNVSEDIAYSDELDALLSATNISAENLAVKIMQYADIKSYISKHDEIAQIQVYTNNQLISEGESFLPTTLQVEHTWWYQEALSQSEVLWVPMKITSEEGEEGYQMALVRKIHLTSDRYHAIVVILLDEEYLHKRLDTTEYKTAIYVDDKGYGYSGDPLWFEAEDLLVLFPGDAFYEYTGGVEIGDRRYMATVRSQKMDFSSSILYVCSLSPGTYADIYRMLLLMTLITLFAIALPFVLLYYFTEFFTDRVNTLRKAMHEVSQENYDVPVSLTGNDEISKAFSDLGGMVAKIKDKDATMYQSKISEQQLQNEQQLMEFKMLASQINPHFLYNTLETIRMRAFTAGDKEVATAIKLLGKSMRYVLENTGVSITTLQKELDYIETYLQIQQLRFADRVNYTFLIPSDLNLDQVGILPLLLQPVVENAILHGLEETEANGQLRISITTQQDTILRIAIADNGMGMDKNTMDDLRKRIETPHQTLQKSIGLYNIHQRVRLYYGDEYGISIDSQESVGTCISLRLPLLRMERDQGSRKELGIL